MTALTQAQGELVEAYLPLVDSAVRRMHKRMHREPDIQDLRQDAIIGLIAAACHSDPACRASFASYAWKWINGAMLNARHKWTRPTLVASEALMENAWPLYVRTCSVSRAERMDIRRCLERLTKLQRQALLWHYWDGMTNREIAARLKRGQPPSVSDLIRRARLSLGEKLKEGSNT